jgi:predicted metalloprotease
VTSLSTVRDFYTELLRCMNKAWAPLIRAAGFTFQAPKLVVTKGQSNSSPCEFADGLAYYCDRTIYMDAKADLSVRRVHPDVVKVWMAFDFGHEYAHHVQALTGILQAKYQRGLTLNGVDLALEESRRLELQASCLSGVYFGADRATLPVTAGWRTAYRWIVSNSNDPARDHGNNQSLTRWAMAGLDAADPAACNTYTAGSTQVS